jgi:small redox-active disulfide protein 2
MGLLNFGRKKEKDTEPSCACSSGCSGTGMDITQENQPVEENKALESVKVLGSGCKSCHELLENTNKALKEMSVPFEAEYVTDMEKIMAYGAMSMPALVVNEKVVSMGRVMGKTEVEKLLKKIGY